MGIKARTRYYQTVVAALGELLTNNGWEAGICPEFGDWVHTGSYVLCPRTSQPRSGLYALRGYTPSGTTQWGKVTFTVTDPYILSLLANKDVKFSVYSWCKLIFSASDADNHREIEVGDNTGSTITAIPKLPYETWQLVTATHTITAKPTKVFFSIYYYKGGYRAIYEINIDDMTGRRL